VVVTKEELDRLKKQRAAEARETFKTGKSLFGVKLYLL